MLQTLPGYLRPMNKVEEDNLTTPQLKYANPSLPTVQEDLRKEKDVIYPNIFPIPAHP